MKTTNLLAAALVAFGLATTASAQTKIYISGAPAVRQSATVAIEHLLAANGGTITRAFNGTNVLVANVVTWTGGNIGGTPVTIKLAYTGSAAGYQAVAGQIPVRFLPDSVNGLGQGQTDVNASLGAAAESHVPDFTFADEFQASTPWIGTNSLAKTAYATGGATYGSPQAYQTLTDDVVGILPLRVVASPGAPFTNITPQLAQQVYEGGGIPLSQFTGNASDVNSTVYGLGRDVGSGARTLWLAETGVGTNTLVQDYQPAVTVTNKSVVKIIPFAGGSNYTSAPTVTLGAPSSGTTATAHANLTGGKVTSYTIDNPGSGYAAAPTITIAGGGGDGAYGTVVIGGGTVTANPLYANQDLIGIHSTNGNGGYSTFGAELTAIAANPSAAGGYFIAYVADADAQTALAAGAVEVAWNGVFLGTLGTSGTASPALANGQYSLWGYIRIAHLSNLVTTGSGASIQGKTEKAISDQLRNYDAQVLLSDVNVQRLTDGGQIFQGQWGQ